MIVLDTHAFVQLAEGAAKLTRAARRAIDREQSRGGLVISDATLVEIVTLDVSGKIKLETPFGASLRAMVDETGVNVRPVNPSIAARAHGLSGALAEPMDRVIVATALELGCALVTSDGEITTAKVVKTIW